MLNRRSSHSTARVFHCIQTYNLAFIGSLPILLDAQKIAWYFRMIFCILFSFFDSILKITVPFTDLHWQLYTRRCQNVYKRTWLCLAVVTGSHRPAQAPTVSDGFIGEWGVLVGWTGGLWLLQMTPRPRFSQPCSPHCFCNSDYPDGTKGVKIVIHK